jgi:hypothetical protein
MNTVIASTAEDFDAWDAFVSGHRHGTHSQLSWFMRSMAGGRLSIDVLMTRDEARDEQRVVGGAALYTLTAPVVGTRVTIVGHGPLVEPGNAAALSATLEGIRGHIERTRPVLVQFEAHEADVHDAIRERFADRKISAQPIWKLWHPVLWREVRVALKDKTEADLLAGFNQTTRRKIRKADKADVRIRPAKDESEMPEVHAIWCEDADRQGYAARPLDQIVSLYRESTQRGIGDVLIAEVDGAVAAFNMIFHFGVGSYYLHGGFREKHADACPNHPLQFEAMKRALARGKDYYSLAAPGRGGLAQYKAGFGGEIVDHTRFVSVPWRPLPLKLMRGAISNIRLAQTLKRIFGGARRR